MQKKEFYIILTYMIKKGDKKFIALCPEFDIASQGDSIEEASDNLKDAISLYFEGIEELGTRDIIFRERNIKVYSSKPQTITEEIKLSDNSYPLINKQVLQIAS
jgi:predicted RNase H-like HicB family nuclease